MHPGTPFGGLGASPLDHDPPIGGEATGLPATPSHNLGSFLSDIAQLEAIFSTWDTTARATVEAYRRAIEAINGEALRRLVRALKADPTALAAMKQAAGDEIVYAVLRHHDIVKASLSERVEVALEGIRPMLSAHGGDVELVEVNPPTIAVRFLGACDGCAASALTFHAGVKQAVQTACPEITEIRHVKGLGGANGVRFVSPFAPGTDHVGLTK
jgi:Fe-S cluster biogenesis protein NfuA